MDYQYAILAATWYRSSGSQIYLHILAAKSASKQQHENYSIKNRRGSRSINDGSAISLQVFKDLCSEKCFGPCRWKVYRSWRGAEVIVQSETFPLCFFPFLSFSFSFFHGLKRITDIVILFLSFVKTESFCSLLEISEDVSNLKQTWSFVILSWY